MPHMISLPYELLEAIVDEVCDLEDVKTVRLLNRTFCALGSSRLFERVEIRNSVRSAARFGELVRSGSAAPFVAHISFQECHFADPQITRPHTALDVEGRSWLLWKWRHRHERDPEEEEPDVAAPAASLCASFALLHTLPALRSLTLDFLGRKMTPAFLYGSADSVPLQTAILSALLDQPRLPPYLTSLHLRGLAVCNNPLYNLPSFQALFGPLTALSIEASSLQACPTRQFKDGAFAFWEHTIQRQVFSALSLSRTLTCLNLHSDHDVGVVPALDFAALRLPALARLSLQGILFAEANHLEDWIAQHGAPLRALHLDECRIALVEPPSRPPRRVWAQVWDRLARALRALTELTVQSESGLAPASGWDVDLNYVTLRVEEGFTYELVHTEVCGAEGDALALASFYGVVSARRRAAVTDAGHRGLGC